MNRTVAGLAGFAAAILFAASPAAAESECKPSNALKDLAALPGKKGWVWADSEIVMRNGPRGIGMAHTWKQIGPDRWVHGDDLVPYGEAVEIVKHEEWHGSSGRTTVRTADGRTFVVPGATIKLYEFWKCSVTELLEDRYVLDKESPIPRNVRTKVANTVWVRLVDKTTPVESWKAWMKPEDVAKIDLMLCRQWTAPDQKPNHGEYPLSCQPFSAKGWGSGLSLDPKAVEVLSPTSMRILLTN
ncbi:hypothetical protein BHAOGJBA_1178 [Methylobacterium hispanicum]|uniref:Uncharacterized protein n=1 Tax=Methylobacterium hispanicum TaxID=270350 RepID=A0AAV4ZHL0_9HYPH|nr:hypothetical protein [Methylobacterium hispanicum]GJD87673.1 hypothetical protein BHAOGJBA_1178 [Methylobacterium hispanicum]